MVGKILNWLCWCEEVDVDVSEGWGISTSSNHRHLLCSISHNSGCWLTIRPGWHGEETAIWYSRSSGSSTWSLQFQSESALFQVCWTARIAVWVFLLSSPSSRSVERPLWMPAMSSNSKVSDERSKMKTKLVRNIEMMKNIQSVEKNAKTSLLDRKNKYWILLGGGGGVGGEHS